MQRKMTTKVRYAKPPIIEAVIDFQFSEPIPEKIRDKLARELKSAFPNRLLEKEINLSVVSDSQVDLDHQPSGLKLLSEDNLDIILIRQKNLANARLAPYQGWEVLRDRTVSVWRKASKFLTLQSISRIGVRFINRLDIPAESVRVADWATIDLKTPLGSKINEFGMRVVSRDGASGSILIFGSTKSPLLHHNSFMLDIDVFVENEIPKRETEVWQLVEELREKKNLLFEHSITEGTRRLFGVE